MEFNALVTVLSIAVSVLMFTITYMYAQPLKTVVLSIKECVQEIKATINEMRGDARELRQDVDRLKDHEKAMWRIIDELKERMTKVERGDGQ